MAHSLGVGFVPIRKAGKLPGATMAQQYDLEYGTDTIEIHADAVSPGEHVLVLDDVLATGGTAAARPCFSNDSARPRRSLVPARTVVPRRASQARRCSYRDGDRGGWLMSTVTRVLPWRRAANRPPSAEIAPLLAEYAKHHPKAETTMIEAAFAVAEEAHRGQNRKSGEPYIRHPVAVATVVARQGLDDISIAAALLHDAVEDTVVGLEELEREFSAELAASSMGSPSSIGSITTPRKSSRPPRCAR